MSERPGEPTAGPAIEPLPRLLAQLAWRFVLVAGVVVGLAELVGSRHITGSRHPAIDLGLAVGGLAALVEGATRAQRSVSSETGRAVLLLVWPAAALWVLGCLLQGVYVRSLAEAGQEAAWERTWQQLGEPMGWIGIVLSVFATSSVPLLAYARAATPHLGGQLAIAILPAALLGGAPVLLFVGLFGMAGTAAANGLGGATFGVFGAVLGAFTLRGLDLLEARLAPSPRQADEVG